MIKLHLEKYDNVSDRRPGIYFLIDSSLGKIVKMSDVMEVPEWDIYMPENYILGYSDKLEFNFDIDSINSLSEVPKVGLYMVMVKNDRLILDGRKIKSVEELVNDPSFSS